MSRRTSKPAAAGAARAQANPARPAAAGPVTDATMPKTALAATAPALAQAVVADAGERGAETPSLELAGEVRRLMMAGRAGEARELYGDVVARHQRRAWRLACYYLRDTAEADEAVQDAFVKAFSHLPTYDPARSFEVWLTRILVNSCLDRV